MPNIRKKFNSLINEITHYFIRQIMFAENLYISPIDYQVY